MQVLIHEVCSQCPAEDPKVIYIFTREKTCGKACFAEAQVAYARMIARFYATEIEEGNRV